jgi:hypothetical protein
MFKQTNKFKLEISGISCGWVGLNFNVGDIVIKHVSGSEYFNPFRQFEELVCALKNSLKYTLEIDQEGYSFEFKVIEYKNNSVLVSMCNFKDYNSIYYEFKNGIQRLHHLKDIKKERIWINKKELVKGIIKGLEIFNQKKYKKYLTKEKVYYMNDKKNFDYKISFKEYLEINFNLNKIKYNNFFKKDFKEQQYKYIYPLVNS